MNSTHRQVTSRWPDTPRTAATDRRVQGLPSSARLARRMGAGFRQFRNRGQEILPSAGLRKIALGNGQSLPSQVGTAIDVIVINGVRQIGYIRGSASRRDLDWRTAGKRPCIVAVLSYVASRSGRRGGKVHLVAGTAVETVANTDIEDCHRCSFPCVFLMLVFLVVSHHCFLSIDDLLFYDTGQSSSHGVGRS
jgi:hypothetical protein